MYKLDIPVIETKNVHLNPFDIDVKKYYLDYIKNSISNALELHKGRLKLESLQFPKAINIINSDIFQEISDQINLVEELYSEVKEYDVQVNELENQFNDYRIDVKTTVKYAYESVYPNLTNYIKNVASFINEYLNSKNLYSRFYIDVTDNTIELVLRLYILCKVNPSNENELFCYCKFNTDFEINKVYPTKVLEEIQQYVKH